MGTLSAHAEDYFKSMNSIAKRIHEDVQETKNAYEDIWFSLTDKEKEEILNDSMIKPDIVLKYALHTLDNLEFDINDPPIKCNNLMSFFGREHSSKIIHDDSTNTSWRDEHSGPFLYHTKSQLNLCVLNEERTVKDVKAVSPNPASELEISHSKVVSELKNALKKQELRSMADEAGDRSTMSPTNLLSKFMSNFKVKPEDSQHLVSREPEQSAGPTSSIFSNIFMSPHKDSSIHYEKDFRNSAVKSNSDNSEENRGLLSNASLNSSGTDFHSCDGSPEKDKSSETITTGFSRCGFDFLDNW